jgi:predicted DNA-binding transcriptional regulator AlpA
MDARARLLTTGEVASMIRMSKAWLEQDRHRSEGARIPFLKLGKSCRYRLSDVEAFIEGLPPNTTTPREKRPRKTQRACNAR